MANKLWSRTLMATEQVKVQCRYCKETKVVRCNKHTVPCKKCKGKGYILREAK